MKQTTSRRRVSSRPNPTLPVALIAALIAALGLIAFWWFNQMSVPAPAEQTRSIGDLRLTLRVTPPMLGEQTIELEARTTGGQPVELQNPQLRFSMTEMDMGQLQTELNPLGNGRYQAQGKYLTMAGQWQIDATVQTPDQGTIRTRFDLPIAAIGEVPGPLNPLQNDAQTILSGQRLYLANCATCHGQRGQGDGPLAAGLSPAPANFSIHMLPGKHSDGQIFLWIKDGYPSQQLPGWGDRLSEEQIWQLVTYLKTYGQPAAAPSATAYPAPASGASTPAPIAPTTGLASVPTINEPLPAAVFARSGNIWSSEGDQIRPLTNLPPEEYPQYPTLSPDGTQIAFIVIKQPPISAAAPLPVGILYVMNRDGSNLRSVFAPKQGLLGLTAWTPDGKAVLVGANGVRTTDGGRDLAILQVDVSAGTFQALVEDGMDPVVSRDGRQLGYLRLSPDGYIQSLMIANLDGSNPQVVIDGKDIQGLYGPRFSPDGQKLIVAAIGGPLPPQGQPPTTPWDWLLGWLAPTNAEAHGLPWDLWEVRVDGSGLRQLTNLFEDLPLVSFSPDGQQIVFMGAGGIYRMNPDGSQLRRIDQLGDHGGIEWLR